MRLYKTFGKVAWGMRAMHGPWETMSPLSADVAVNDTSSSALKGTLKGVPTKMWLRCL